MALSDSHVSYQQPRGLPDADALRELAAIWSEGRSGVLRFDSGRAVLVHGEPREAEDLRDVMAAVYAGESLSFSAADAFGRPPPPRLARALWEAAERLTRPQDLRGTARSEIVRGPLFARISAFPLQAETAALLRRFGVCVGETVRMDKPTRLLVLNDLAVLRLLGGVEIDIPRHPPKKLKRAQPRADPVVRSRPTTPRSPAPLGRPDPALKARLTADLRRTEQADAWTVIGVRRGALKAEVDAWCERMLKRYADILAQDLDRETRALAERMHLRVRDAAIEVRRSPAAEPRTAPSIRPIDEVGKTVDADSWDHWRD